MKKSSLIISSFVVICILFVTVILIQPVKTTTTTSSEFFTIGNKTTLTEDEQFTLTYLENIKESIEVKINAQKELLYLVSESMSDEEIKQWADQLVAYKLTINTFPYSTHYTTTSNDGPLEVKVTATISDLFTDNKFPQLKKQLDIAAIKQTISQITPTNNTIQGTNIALSNELQFSYFIDDITTLNTTHDKIFFEVSPTLQTELGFDNSSIAVYLTTSDIYKHHFFNEDYFYLSQSINQLLIQEELLDRILKSSSIANIPYEEIISLIQPYTSTETVLTDVYNRTIITESRYEVSNNPIISFVIDNPLFTYLPLPMYNDYIHSFQSMAQIELSDKDIFTVHNMYTDFTYGYAVLYSSMDFQDVTDPITITFLSNEAKQAPITLIPIGLEKAYQQIPNLQKYSSDYSSISYEMQQMIMKDFYHTFYSQLSLPTQELLPNKLVTYELFGQFVSILSNNYQLHYPSTIESKLIISELLLNDNSPFYTDTNYKKDIQNDLTLVSNHDLQPFYLQGTNIFRYGYFFTEDFMKEHKNENVTINVSEQLTSSNFPITTGLDVDVYISQNQLNNNYRNKHMYNSVSKALSAYSDYTTEQTSLIINLLNYVLTNEPELEEEIYNFVFNYSFVQSVSILDDQLNEEITKTTYAVDSTPTLEIEFFNPILYSLYIFRTTSEQIGNIFMEPFKTNKDITLMQYPNIQYDHTEQIYNLYIQEDQFPVEITFSDELVDKLALPAKTITLEKRE